MKNRKYSLFSGSDQDPLLIRIYNESVTSMKNISNSNFSKVF